MFSRIPPFSDLTLIQFFFESFTTHFIHFIRERMINLIGSLKGVRSVAHVDATLPKEVAIARRKVVSKKGSEKNKETNQQNENEILKNAQLELHAYLTAYDSCSTVVDNENNSGKKRKHAGMEMDTKTQRAHFHYSHTVPVDALHTFLAHVDTAYTAGNESKKGSDPAFDPLSATEWALVQRLVSEGLVSLGSCRSLLSAAAACKQRSLLVDMARNVPDLDERDSLLLLRLILSLDDEVFLLPTSQLAPVTTILEQQAMKAAPKKGKKKTESLPVASDHKTSPAAARLLVVQSLLRALLERATAFSGVMLTAVAKTILSPTMAVFLLRQLSLLLREYCTGTSGMSEAVSQSLTEEQVRRAVVWAEALLDSHFSAIAIHAHSDAATRLALRGLLEILAAAGDGVEPLESALAACSHAHRMCQFTQPLHKQLQSLDQAAIDKGSVEDRTSNNSKYSNQHGSNGGIKTVNKMYSIEKLVL